jgi:hypothetical protein
MQYLVYFLSYIIKIKIKIYFEKRDLKFQTHKRIEKDEYPKA